jgi:hypothetical protein
MSIRSLDASRAVPVERNLAAAFLGFQFRPGAMRELFGHPEGANVEVDVIPLKAGDEAMEDPSRSAARRPIDSKCRYGHVPRQETFARLHTFPAASEARG